MSARLLAQSLAAGRLAFGAAMLVAPGKVTSGWVGADRPEYAPIVRGFGIRDVAIGAGTLAALSGNGAVKPWLIGAAAGDGVDLLAGLAAAKHLPRNGVLGVGALAGTALAVGVWLSAQDW